MNVEQFAQELKLSSALLLEQLRAAGVVKSAAGDEVTEQDKSRLLDYLSKKHGARDAKGKITLTRRETTEIRRSDSSTGKPRTIQVEVRKKRVLVKREPTTTPDKPEGELLADNEMRAEDFLEPVVDIVAEETVPTVELPAEQEVEPAAEEIAAVATTEVPEPASQAVPLEPVNETVPEAVAEIPAVAEAVPRAVEAEAGVVTRRRLVRPVLDEQELARRAEEVRRQSALHARQAEEIREKQEREQRRKQVQEQQLQAAKVPAPVVAEKPAAAAADTTLHKPAAAKPAAAKPADGARTDKPADKKPREVPGKAKENTWNDMQARKRGIKSRGDTGTAGDAWRNRKAGGRHQKSEHDANSGFNFPVEPVVQEILLPETITVAELAHKMSVKAAEVIKVLMKLGSMVTINQVLDQETAMIVVEDMGHIAKPAPLDTPEAFLE